VPTRGMRTGMCTGMCTGGMCTGMRTGGQDETCQGRGQGPSTLGPGGLRCTFIVCTCIVLIVCIGYIGCIGYILCIGCMLDAHWVQWVHVHELRMHIVRPWVTVHRAASYICYCTGMEVRGDEGEAVLHSSGMYTGSSVVQRQARIMERAGAIIWAHCTPVLPPLQRPLWRFRCPSAQRHYPRAPSTNHKLVDS